MHFKFLAFTFGLRRENRKHQETQAESAKPLPPPTHSSKRNSIACPQDSLPIQIFAVCVCGYRGTKSNINKFTVEKINLFYFNMSWEI